MGVKNSKNITIFPNSNSKNIKSKNRDIIIKLPKDLIIYLSIFLDDKSNISFFSANKTYHKYIKEIIYKNTYDYTLLFQGYKLSTIKIYDEITDFSFIPFFVKKIIFDDFFNNLIINLPETVKEIKFGKHFNRNIDNISDKLIRIEFGNDFNQPINHISTSIKVLTFGKEFNHPLVNLPESLIVLDLYYSNYNHSIENFPNSIQKLYLGPGFSLSIGKFPNSLKFFQIVGNYNLKINFPNLIKLCLPSNYTQIIDNLPESLEVFYFYHNDNIDFINLPKSLKKMAILGNFNKPLLNIPSNVKSIIIMNRDYSHSINHLLRRGIDVVLDRIIRFTNSNGIFESLY